MKNKNGCKRQKRNQNIHAPLYKGPNEEKREHG